MAHRFIATLKPGEQVEDQIFLIRQKDLRTTSQGGMYIHAVLADRTGQLVARAWQATEAMYNALPEGGFVKLKGRTENYKGSPQFIIDAIRMVEDSEVEISDFLPATEKDVDQMFARVLEILEQVKHPDLKAIMDEYLCDEKLMANFKRAPAAFAMHHAYIGGLLEHTLALMELSLRVIPLYPKLSLELVLLSAFLHDLGKTSELYYQTSIGYSDEGQLIGHITRGAIWLEERARAVSEKRGESFPKEVLQILQHMLLSHHGKYEFGSPKLPAIPEAIALHHLDNLDAKVHMFTRELGGELDPKAHWTNFNRAIETKVYKVDCFGTRGN